MKNLKSTIVLSLSGFLLSACASYPDAITSIELLPAVTEITTGEKADIHILVKPSAKTLSESDFTCSGGQLHVEKDQAVFTSEETGTYTLIASRDGITSNTISIEVRDKSDSSPDQTEKPSGTDSDVNDRQDDKGNTGDQNNETNFSDDLPATDQTASSLRVEEVLKNPDAYINQSVTVEGLLPQDNILSDSGESLVPLYPLSGNTDIALILQDERSLVNFGGCQAAITGVLKKESHPPYQYVLEVTSANATSDGSAGENQNRKPGTAVSTLPSSGVFHFTVDDLIIRNGEDGLEGANSGYVFDAGMSVHYDKVYQKDGYTWIAYTAAGGARHSVAIGSTQSVLYGYI